LDDVKRQANQPLGVRLPKPLDSQALTVLAAEAMRRATQADFSVQNRGGIRTSLPAGDILYGQIFEVMPFDNAVIRTTLTGAQVERLVKLMLGRRTHGGPTTLAGLKVERQNGELQVRTSKGQPLDRQRRYVMALSDFLVQGGDGGDTVFKNLPDSDKVDTQVSVLDTMIALLQKLYPAPAVKKESHELAPGP
jgi:5'-nucleotidase